MPRRSAASEAEIHSAGMDTSPFPGPGHGGFLRRLATAAGHPTLTSINVDEPVDYQSIIKLTIRVDRTTEGLHGTGPLLGRHQPRRRADRAHRLVQVRQPHSWDSAYSGRRSSWL